MYVSKLFPSQTLGLLVSAQVRNPSQIWYKSIFTSALASHTLRIPQFSRTLPFQRTSLPLLSCRQYQVPANMATSRKIVLTPEDHGVFYSKGLTVKSAAKASEVLQENHDKFHITYNADGFHSEYQFGERCPRFLCFLPLILTFA